MSSHPSTALTKRTASSALMSPPPLPKRIKRPAKVLDEDVYSSAVSHIIARDFFPGILELQAQHEYMEALESNNNDWIREAGRKLTQAMTPAPDARKRMMRGRGTGFETPRRAASAPVEDTPRGYAGETPARTPINPDFAPDPEPSQQDEIDTNLSLSAFQAKYTSEDNESFNALLDKQNATRSARYAFFHAGNNIPSPALLAHRAREQKLLQNAPHTGNHADSSTVHSQELAITSTTAAHSGPSADLSARPASVESFRSKQGPRNAFMFGPEGIEDAGSLQTYAQLAEQKSNAPPKSVAYSATRFPTSEVENERRDSIPPSPSMSAIDAAIAGRPRPRAGADASASSEAEYTGAETPRVNGYAFVDAEPTPDELGLPTPNRDDSDSAEQEENLLHLLPRAEDSANPFHLRAHSKREELHRRLVEKADAGRRKTDMRLERLKSDTATPRGKTPTPRFASAAGMTPAARKLAERIATPRREGVGGQAWGIKTPGRKTRGA